MTFQLFRLTLGSKFLLIILLLLLIPMGSMVLLKEVEKTLVSNLKSNLILSAKLVSLQLSNSPDWFYEIQTPPSEHFVAKEIVVFDLNQAVIIDGVFDEWRDLEKFRSVFQDDSQTIKKRELGLLLSRFQETFQLSLKVFDEKLIYAKGNAGFLSDQLVISFRDNDNNPKRLFISPFEPGQVGVKTYQQQALSNDLDYQAFWLESELGFNFELVFPPGLRPKELRVAHFDVDQTKQTQHEGRVSTSGIELNPLVWPSHSINKYVSQIQLLPGQRLWVLDQQGRVLARNGDLSNIKKVQNSFQTIILDWILDTPSSNLNDRRLLRTKLKSSVVYTALNGKDFSLLENSEQGYFSVALVATPITIKNEIVGAVLIEENVARVQLLQRQNLAQMINFVVLMTLIIILLVIGYVTRLVLRIKKLKLLINEAADDDGRMTSDAALKLADGDEIDDLSNAFYYMQLKLYDYNNYLEKLASRLSHELRTPIAIVSSSLDNLLMNNTDTESQQVIQRALHGTQRLSEIIGRMRQASSVKDAMQSAEFEAIDLCLMLSQYVQGFTSSFPQYQFKFESNINTMNMKVSTDLLAELLDKLLANAMDFQQLGTCITVSLTKTNERLVLAVTNKGDIINKKDIKKIFNSLVSLREDMKQTSQNLDYKQGPNLGLGLYLVKIIANFHGAKVKAENLKDKSGVSIKVIWRLKTHK